MVRLRRLLDRGSEVTFLPGDGSDENRTYEVHVVTVEGNGVTATGPSPQSALLNATRVQPDGGQVTYAQAADGGWFADLRDTTGRSTAAGYGRSHAAALAQLLQRRGLADQADDDGLEPYCGECGAPIGIFLGHGQGWHHHRGAGTAAAPVELYDADHEPAPAWRERAAGDAK
jgi:hypothetical protein